MINLKINWKYSLAFYCIGMLYASLHELIHHVAGFIICGEWGTKSFNYFETACDDDPISYIATYTGPIFTFIMMYVGAYFLNDKFSNYKKHLGFALIFAQLPMQRMISPFFKMNDEYYATANLLGDNDYVYWLVIAVIWIICLPVLIKAYKAINNKNRIIWFLFYFLIFPYLLVVPIFLGLEFLMVEKNILSSTVLGIGWLFILNEIVTIIAHLYTKKYIYPHRK